MELDLPSCQIIGPGGFGTWLTPQQAPERTSWGTACWQCRICQQPGRGWRNTQGAPPHLPSPPGRPKMQTMWNPSNSSCLWRNGTMPQYPLTGTRVKRKPWSWCVSPPVGFFFLNFIPLIPDSPFPEAPAAPIFSIYAVSFITSFPFSASYQLVTVLFILNFWPLQNPSCIFSDSHCFCPITSWIIPPSRTGLFLSLVLLFHWIFPFLLIFLCSDCISSYPFTPSLFSTRKNKLQVSWDS